MMGEKNEKIQILRVGSPHRGIKSVIFIWEDGRIVGSLPVPENLTNEEAIKAIKEALHVET